VKDDASKLWILTFVRMTDSTVKLTTDET